MALGIISADPTGHKELVGLWDGHRESEQTWKDLLLDLKSHGLVQGPAVAIGDGALSFWQALRHVYGKTRGQRCWGRALICRWRSPSLHMDAVRSHGAQRSG